MRFGICTGPENIELLEKLGYDYIELNASKMLTLSEEELESIREKLNASKIKCEAFFFQRQCPLLEEQQLRRN